MGKIKLYDEMNHLINYIEEQLLSIKTVDECLDTTYLSKYHVMHVFKQLTGMTLMTYIIRRRLDRSLEDLTSTDLKIIDIAMKYSYQHEQSYIRAFKKIYGVTPLKYRKNPKGIETTHPLYIRKFLYKEDGILLEPRYVYSPQIKLVGPVYDIVGDESYQKGTAKNVGFDFFYKRRDEISCALDSMIYYGVTWHINQDYNNSKYMPSIEVHTYKDIPKKMIAKTVDSGRYAVFTYIGHHSIKELTLKHLMDIHNFAEGDFHGFNLIKENAFFFERIDTKVATETYVEVEIYFRLE